MRKILLIFLFVICSLVSFSQAPIDSTSKKVHNDSTYRKAIALRFRTAGEELTAGSNIMLIGSLFMVGGGLVAALSNGESGTLIAAAGVGGLGVVFNFIGIGKIGIAGRRLRGQYN